MKALGTGIGGFALTDVEVCRTTGKGATRNAPSLRLARHGGRAGGRPGRRHLPPVAHPHRRRGHRLRRRGAGPVRAVLTRDEMRAADAAALSHRLARDPGGARRHRGGARRAPPARGRLRPARRRRGGQGQQRRRRPGRRVLPGPAGRPGRGCSTRADVGGGAALPPCDLVIDGAYGTGFRGSYDAPGVPVGAAVLAIDIPSGVDADSGEAPGRRRAGRPHGDLRRAEAGPAAGRRGRVQRRGRGGRHRHRVPHAAGVAGRGRRRGLASRPGRVRSTSGRPPSAWRPAPPGMEGAAILCTRGAMAAGAGMIRLGSPGDPGGGLAHRGRAHAPARRRAGPVRSWRRRPSARRS